MKSDPVKIGEGIFIWSSLERQSQRYGFFYPSDKDFNETTTVQPILDLKAVTRFGDKRVKITCRVIETRQSGHVGDLALGIEPSTPELGEEIVVGVGKFVFDLAQFRGEGFYTPLGVGIGLCPSDGRKKLWLDPRVLYRLHDQTVEIFVEETDEPDSPKTTLEPKVTQGVISNGDGSYQYVGADEPVRVLPNVEDLGGGTFAMGIEFQGNKGEVFETEITEELDLVIITADKIADTGTVSFRFMFDSKLPKNVLNKILGKPWGYVWRPDRREEESVAFNVWNSSHLVVGGGWSGYDTREWRKQMLDGLPSCVLLMTTEVFEWMRKNILEEFGGRRYLRHHCDEIIATS